MRFLGTEKMQDQGEIVILYQKNFLKMNEQSL